MPKFANPSVKRPSAALRLREVVRRVTDQLQKKTAEAYVDTGVKIIIGVVIGGVILAGLYALFKTNILGTLTTKITQMFNYSGT